MPGAFEAVPTGGPGVGGGPIVILGMMQRTGTNDLAGLLRLHRDTTRPERVGEDFVLFGSHHLVHYVDGIIMYRDNQHLSTRFAATPSNTLGAHLDAILDARSGASSQRLQPEGAGG